MLLLLVSLDVAPAAASSESHDVAALGATASGKVGGVVKVIVGITNNGPDRFVKQGSGGYMVAAYRFRLPPGTETVKAPETELNTIFESGGSAAPNKCSAAAGGPAFGGGPYICYSSPILEAGASSKGTFYLKITKVIPNATGSVYRYVCSDLPDGSEERRNCTDPPPDSDPDNDKASVVINPNPEVVGSVAGLPVTRTVALGGALMVLLLTVGGLYLRARRRAARQ